LGKFFILRSCANILGQNHHRPLRIGQYFKRRDAPIRIRGHATCVDVPAG